MKLTTALKYTTGTNETGDLITKEIKEINLSKEKFTAKVLLEAEQSFLRNGGVYPIDGMQNSRKFLTYVVSEMTEIRYDDLLNLNGEDLIRLTDEVKGFFGNSGLEKLMEIFLEK